MMINRRQIMSSYSRKMFWSMIMSFMLALFVPTSGFAITQYVFCNSDGDAPLKSFFSSGGISEANWKKTVTYKDLSWIIKNPFPTNAKVGGAVTIPVSGYAAPSPVYGYANCEYTVRYPNTSGSTTDMKVSVMSKFSDTGYRCSRSTSCTDYISGKSGVCWKCIK